MTLGGDKSGGNPALSADAVAFCLRMLVALAPSGRRLDLARWGYGFTARFDCRSVGHIAPESPSKLAFVVGVDLGIVAADKANAVRLRALVFLLRYSGLRIRDAVTLSRNRIQDDKLFLYTAKTGTAVYCPLPPFVVKALDVIPASTYFFWTGLSKPKSAVGDWQRSLKRLLILAGVPDGHAHRFRDTFSVELLLAGVPIERVSILLGHQSVRITEKHYAPWVRARQEQLEADVRRTWQTHEPQQGVHGRYTENDARVIPFKSRRKNGGGGGSRTPVRKALRHEAYMLSSIPFGSPATLRMSKKRSRLVR